MSYVDGLSRASLGWDHTGKPVFVPEILPVPDRCMRLVRVEIECFMPGWIVHKNTRYGFRVRMAMLGPIRRDCEIHAIFISSVIASTRSVAASPTSGPTAFRTRQLSQL